MSSNVIDFHTTNDNYKQVCTLAVSPYWNCDMRDRAKQCTGSQFCWVHGFHTYVCHGEYVVTTYTNLAAMEGKKYINDAVTKNWITIRGQGTQEWNFECPAELVGSVTSTLKRHPMWVKFVIKNGMNLKLAMHLADRACVDYETQQKIDELDKTYSRLINNLYYARESDGSYVFDPITHAFVYRDETTMDEKQAQHQQIDAYFDPLYRAIHIEHARKIAEQDLNNKTKH